MSRINGIRPELLRPTENAALGIQPSTSSKAVESSHRLPPGYELLESYESWDKEGRKTLTVKVRCPKGVRRFTMLVA